MKKNIYLFKDAAHNFFCVQNAQKLYNERIHHESNAI